MIVGIAFVSIVQLIAAGTVANVDSQQLTTGVNLARNIRELTLQEKFADLKPLFNAVKYSPPHDSKGAAITQLAGWEQAITVQPVDPAGLTTNIVASSPSAVRITVTVNHNNAKVCDLSWYCFDATP